MQCYFFETSALVKRYKWEPGSDYVDGIFKNESTFYYLDLAVLEVRKAFYRLYKYPQNQDIQKRETFTEEQFHNAEAQFAADLLRMRCIHFDSIVIQKAALVLEQRWLASVFDLVQLAAFLVVRDLNPATYLVCSDARSSLIEVAQQVCDPHAVIIPEQQSTVVKFEEK